MSNKELGSRGIGSKAEFVTERRGAALKYMDLTTPTSRVKIIETAWDLHMSQMHTGDAEGIAQDYPDIDAQFVEKMVIGLTENLEPTITGAEVAMVYEETVESVAAETTRDIRTLMFMPDAYGNVLDHFGVPISPEVIEQVEDPVLAETYRQRTARWIGQRE